MNEMQHLRGFRGVILVSKNDQKILGYAVALETHLTSGRELKIGPLYALNLPMAVRILNEICRTVKPDKIISLYVLDAGSNQMVRFLEERALFEVQRQYNRFFTADATKFRGHLNNVFAISAQLLLPDC
ncbi:unnamed protein product [Gongylonema pulchrum]|uniref:YitH/HolE acetyltransferase (GNAT) domain-containing protein n=1 Tax=Gongylonema pulchrum TaxID=637853 RepID=A0A3P7S4L2_9BILA|nr:unnamed protein product [Gongylonema pulchrum]